MDEEEDHACCCSNQRDLLTSSSNSSSSVLERGSPRRSRRLNTLEKCLVICLAVSLAAIVALVFAVVRKDGDTQTEEGLTLESVPYSSSTTENPGRKEASVESDSEAVSDLERLEDLLVQKWTEKISRTENDFVRRFPRDQYRSSAASVGRTFKNLPKPLKTDQTSSIGLSDDQKVQEIVYSLDEDNDGAADPWELHDWIVWVEKIVHRHVLNEQWEDLGGNNQSANTLSWGDYQAVINPHGLHDRHENQRWKRDRRRWQHADGDGNEILTKHEFKHFIFPQISSEGSASVLVPEALEDLDEDGDGMVDLEEFLAVHEDPSDISGAEKYFNQTLDADSNGLVDVSEIVQWVRPAGFITAKSEVVYLMEALDADGDKIISAEEATAEAQTFLESQATYFGRLYELRDLRASVFQLSTV